MRSFITGSRAYGKPKEDSDVDLVVLVGSEQLEILKSLADNVINKLDEEDEVSDGGPNAASLRFGKLNLIAVTTDNGFAVWRAGTSFLEIERQKTDKPILRKRAIEVFTALRQKLIPKKTTK